MNSHPGRMRVNAWASQLAPRSFWSAIGARSSLTFRMRLRKSRMRSALCWSRSSNPVRCDLRNRRILRLNPILVASASRSRSPRSLSDEESGSPTAVSGMCGMTVRSIWIANSVLFKMRPLTAGSFSRLVVDILLGSLLNSDRESTIESFPSDVGSSANLLRRNAPTFAA